MEKKENNKEKLVSFFLRIGLVVVFIYAGVSSLVSPQNWIGFFPSFLRVSWTLVLFSLYEIILGLWILSNRRVFYAAVISAISMFFIVAFNLALMDLVFRDIGLFFMAVALAVLSKKG